MKLKHNHRLITGYIEHTKCTNCSCELYNFMFSGDTDMATGGLVALAKSNTREIAIIEATDDEWNYYSRDLMSQRVNSSLNVSGFTVIEYGHFINNNKEKEWLPKCPACGNKHLKVAQLKISDFKSMGGQFYMI